MAYDLQLSHIGKVYDNGTPAVIDFNLDVDKGEFIAFLGPSGCGKTTTLRCVAGFELPTDGLIRFDGADVTMLPPEKRDIGMVFQSFNLWTHRTVLENLIEVPVHVLKTPKDEAIARARKLLRHVRHPPHARPHRARWRRTAGASVRHLRLVHPRPGQLRPRGRRAAGRGPGAAAGGLGASGRP